MNKNCPPPIFFVNNTSMSFYLDLYNKYENYLCQFIWTSTVTNIYLMSIYLEALLFYFVKITSMSFLHRAGAMILKNYLI